MKTKQECFLCRTDRLLEDLRNDAPDQEDMCRDCVHDVTDCRVCFHCREEKPLSEFVRNKGMLGGYGYECKVCHRARSRGERSEASREKDRERSRRAYADNPGATRARAMIARLIRAGFITREPCQLCDGEEDIHAHHPDYLRPLAVNWLCRACHFWIEKLIRDEAPVPLIFVHDYSYLESSLPVLVS